MFQCCLDSHILFLRECLEQFLWGRNSSLFCLISEVVVGNAIDSDCVVSPFDAKQSSPICEYQLQKHALSVRFRLEIIVFATIKSMYLKLYYCVQFQVSRSILEILASPFAAFLSLASCIVPPFVRSVIIKHSILLPINRNQLDFCLLTIGLALNGYTSLKNRIEFRLRTTSLYAI